MTVLVLSAAALNHYANLPEVRPFISPPDQPLDLSWYLDAGALALHCDGATALFEGFYDHTTDENGYVGHYLFPKEVRGEQAFRAAAEILNYIFDVRHARVVRGITPRDNRAARLLSAKLGFRPVGSTVDRYDRDCVIFELKAKSWAHSSVVGAVQRKQPAQP